MTKVHFNRKYAEQNIFVFTKPYPYCGNRAAKIITNNLHDVTCNMCKRYLKLLHKESHTIYCKAVSFDSLYVGQLVSLQKGKGTK